MSLHTMFLITLALFYLDNAEIIEFPKYTLSGRIASWDRTPDDDGLLIVDTEDIMRPWGFTELSSKFSCFPEDIKSPKDMLANKIFDYLENNYSDICPSFHYYYANKIYEFQAALVMAYYGLDIKPTDLQFLNCHPLRLTTYLHEGGTAQENFNSTCGIQFRNYSLTHGISPENCYSGEGGIGEACKTQCVKAEEGDQLVVYGKSLRLAQITDEITESRLKTLMARFGPVLAYVEDKANYQVYFGWEVTKKNETYFKSMTRDGTKKLEFSKEFTTPFNRITEVYFATGQREKLLPYESSACLRISWVGVLAVIVVPAVMVIL